MKSADTIPTNKQDITDYLQTLLAEELQIPKNVIRPSAGFGRFGLNSMKAVLLSEKLSNHFNISVEPTLFLDYDSIEALAAYLEEQLTAL